MLKRICKQMVLLTIAAVMVLQPLAVSAMEATDVEPLLRVVDSHLLRESDVIFVDIKYIATPSPGAVVTEVYYYVGEGRRRYIYLSLESGRPPLGTLGEARVVVETQGGHIEFAMVDSIGARVSYTVYNHNPPRLRTIEAPRSAPGTRVFCREIWSYVFLDRIFVHTYRTADLNLARAAIASVGGEVVGQMPGDGGAEFIVDVNVSTARELHAIERKLLSNYPDLISSVRFNLGIAMPRILPNLMRWPLEIYQGPGRTMRPSISIGNYHITTHSLAFGIASLFLLWLIIVIRLLRFVLRNWVPTRNEKRLY